MDLCFFTLADDGDSLVPTPLAQSAWGADHLHGVAVSGALARAVERRVRDLGREDVRPARYTVDLFRPATTEPCTVATEVVREGPRLCLVDATCLQDGRAVARASALFLKATANPSGAVWSPADGAGDDLEPPSLDVAPVTDVPHVPFLRSDADWSQDFREHQNAGRKLSWNTCPAIVGGEAPTPFQAAASVADGASLVTNWGTNGVEHINTDITLALAREPDGVSIGLAAVDRREQDGIAVGTAAVFDRSGRLGTVVITSLANARRSVDLGATEYDDGASSPRA